MQFLPIGIYIIAGKNECNTCENEVGYRDDTVPKAVDTKRH